MSERSFMENWSLGSDEIAWVDCFNLRHDNLDESAQGRLSPEDYRGRTQLIYAYINPYGRYDIDLDARIDFDRQAA